MPTIDNSETGSGRVTRSLRKRLTSVDTDSSSRPGTPVISSLQTLQETVTPSKRTTRRTSVSTPVPTPSKAKGRLDNIEVANSPARRSIRRRSLSINDQEDVTTHVKSKEPAFEVVQEEETGEKSPELKSKRATRHSPRSVSSSQSERLRSETPKSDKTVSPEVSPRVLLHMKHTKVMLKKEHIDNSSAQKKNKQKQSREAIPRKNSPLIIDSSPGKMQNSEECDSEQNVVVEKLTTPRKTLETSLKSDDVKSNASTGMRTPLKKNVEAIPEESIRTETEPSLSATEMPEVRSESKKKVGRLQKIKMLKEATPQRSVASSPGKMKSPEKSDSDSEQNVVVEKLATPRKSLETSLKSDDDRSHASTVMRTPLKKNIEASLEESLRTESEPTLSATEITQVSPEPNNKAGRPKMKSVGFNNTAAEDEEKNIFPKTPGLTKSKSYILDSSKPDENDAINKLECNFEHSHDEIDKASVKGDADEDENEILNTKTPYKMKLNSVESSTPIQSSSAMKSENDSDQKDTSTKNSEGSKDDFTFPKSWSHSVSGTANDLVKIDSIESEESLQKKAEERRSLNKSASTSKSSKKKRTLRDDSDEELMDEDDSLGEEEEEKEREKSMFVDDEAMEVAEGEESMDSEERAYLEENEIPVYAESIGSVDTVEDECEEEADEEDAAFVVSDTEEILQEEDSDSETSINVKKKYKRIVRHADSSDEDSDSGRKKDEDFCLIIESSLDDEIGPKKSRKEKFETESLNDTNVEIKEDPEKSKKIKSLDSSLLEKSATSSEKIKSFNIKEKEEVVDIISEEIEAKDQENIENRPDNDAESLTDADATDGKLSKKERKSLNKKKILEAKEKSMIATEEENSGLYEDREPEGNSNKRKSLKNKDQVEEIGDESNTNEQKNLLSDIDLDAETTADTDVTKKKLSKKERKSLNMSKSSEADQNSLVTLEEGSEEPVKSANKRKSLNKHEEDQTDNFIGNEMETEDERKSLGGNEFNTDIVSSPSSQLSKKERKSLNKSKVQEQGYLNASQTNKDKSDDPICSPYKRKSLKNKEASFIDFAEKETRSPNKSIFQEEKNTATPDRKSSKKKRMSVTSSKVVHESNDENIEMMDIGNSEFWNEDSKKEAEFTSAKESLKKSRLSLNKSKLEISRYENEDMVDIDSKEETEITPVKEKSFNKSRLSLNKSKSEKLQNHANDSEDNVDKPRNTEHDEEGNLSRNESLRRSGTDSNKEQSTNVQTDEENKSYSINSISRLDDESSLKSPKGKNTSSLKQLRKSLKSGASNEVGYDCFKGISDKLEENSKDAKDKNEDADDEASLGSLHLNVSGNSLNTSKNKKRKSLIRTSTEELADDTEERKFERPADKSQSEKSILFVEDASDTEATTSAVGVSSRISEGKSQNLSRINQKSFNHSRSDIKEEEIESSPKKSDRSNVYTNVEYDSQNDEENEENPESDGDNNENAAEMSKVMEFLGEEEIKSPNLNSTRRKSVNISKFDETFHLESNNASLSRRDSLHRNVLRKSINQNKILSDSMKRTEHKNAVEDSDDDSDVSAQFSAEEEVEVIKKILPDKGLSVSLSGVECKKRKSKGIEEQVHKSFTIGVSLRSTTECSEKDKNISSESSKNYPSLIEKDDLEKIENIQVAGPYKPRNSLSKLLSITSDENKMKKKSKRLSLYMHGDGASQSFVETLTEEKNKVQSKRNRKSNSFSEGVAPCEEPETQPEELEPSKPQMQSSDTSKTGTKTDIQRILSRCDEILEAANRAKLEAKLNAKKTKVKKPKLMDKEEKAIDEEEVKIPLVSKKELKRKEKMKKELAKAIKHSTAMLKTIDPKLVKKLKAPKNSEPEVSAEEPPVTSKRLPADFLDELEEAPKLKKKKTKEIESTPPSDKENSKKNSNKFQLHSDDISDGEKKKKKHSKEIIETASGLVIVEPSTPTKLRYQNGFRESPKTPVGFKIEDTHDKERKKSRKLFSASDAIVENDLSMTSSKKTRKRKFHIEEPVYALPKTQWTSSGVFVEEDVYTVHDPLASSTATQFMVSSLGGSKKPTKSAKVVSSATLSSALNFKKNALFNEKVKREPARKLIHRNERKLVNNRY